MHALNNEDRAVLAAICAAADEIDPVPLDVVAAARASLAWLDVDAELAELVADSGLTAVGVRSATASRLLVFTAGSYEIDIEVIGTADTRRIVGQITPPGPGQLEVRHADIDEPTPAAIDELGRFIVEGVRTGLLSLHCTLEGGAARATTSWVRI